MQSIDSNHIPQSTLMIDHDELWSDNNAQSSNKLDIVEQYNQRHHGIEIQPTHGFVAKLYTIQPIDLHRLCMNAQCNIRHGIKQSYTAINRHHNNRSKTEPGNKIFLNIVGHSSIAPPIFPNHHTNNNTDPDSFDRTTPDVHVPLSCSLPYIDVDKHNNECLLFDICVNVELINKIVQYNNKVIRTIMIEFSLLAIQQKCNELYDILPDINTVTYPKIKYKSSQRTTPLTHYIRQSSTNSSNHSIADVTNRVDDISIQTNNGATNKLQSDEHVADCSTVSATPSYNLYYKLSDSTQIAVNECRHDVNDNITHIIAVIDLLDIDDIDDIDLTLSPHDISIESPNNIIDTINIQLPLTIDDQHSNAVFSKKQHKLTITVPTARHSNTDNNKQVQISGKTKLSLTNTLMYQLCINDAALL